MAAHDPWHDIPALQCDVVMKGGITSGVVYPQAITELAKHYRLRGLGGASAGAIGAALGAAAEFGRDTGGFAKLHELPETLDLDQLFQASRSTRSLFAVLKAAIGQQGAARTIAATALAAMRSFAWQAALGALPGLTAIVFAFVVGLATGWPLLVAGLVLLPIGLTIALVLAAGRVLTRDVPANQFGICTGHSDDPDSPALTDWLSDRIDELAGLPHRDRPLTFGQLRRTTPEMLAAGLTGPRIDLRMMTTCLSQSAAYELPLQARIFYYDPEEWAQLFPAYVMKALRGTHRAAPDGMDDESRSVWTSDNRRAAAHSPRLVRLPVTDELPVIVATRMSLSFPLLISAVPLYTPDRSNKTGFLKLWFSDGGFTSNFPVSMFDAPLPTRPTFAINLGRFPEGQTPSDDESRNVEVATDNRALLPPHRDIPESGIGAITTFAVAAFDSARNWQDNSHLRIPGYRDRIVRVLQTGDEGGLNLDMDAETVRGLAERGRTAAELISAQFREKGGWDNHRWVRYRALMAGMPTFLTQYAAGRATKPALVNAHQTSYKLAAGLPLSNKLAAGLDELAAVTATSSERAVDDLTSSPNPLTVIRRVPRL